MRRALQILLGIILGALVVALLAIILVTNTDWGRERVRRFAQKTIQNAANGQVRIGGISGNLLHGATITDLSIADSLGAPFLSADTATVGYDIGDFIGKRIALSDVRLVNPVVILDERDDEWNWERIFPGDTTQPSDTLPGFGDWIRLSDVTLVNGHVVVRTEWEPSDTTAAARDSAIAAALAGETRFRVDRIPSGYQRVMEFRDIDGQFPRIRVADPDSATMIVEVARASMTALPFRPPAAEVADLAGTFRIGSDSLWFDDARVRMPGSQLVGSGTYILTDTLGLDNGDMRLALHGEPVALADLRWLYPPLPSHGEGTLDFAMLVRGDTSDYVAKNATITVDESRLAGSFGLLIAEDMVFHDTDLRFTNLDTRLIEQVAPALEIPRRGTLGGRAELAGPLSELTLDADVAFDAARAGTSRVVAAGVVGIDESVFSASNLRVRLEPLDVDLVKSATGTQMPVSGTIRGTAVINGSTATRLLARADLVHQGPTGRSHIVGNGVVSLRGGRYLDVDARLLPLSLATVGAFVPAAQLRGLATGDVHVTGPFRNLALESTLRFPDGGILQANGALDIASAEPGYDLTAALKLFNLRSVTARGPATSLTALASARGRGFDPATMRATFAADLSRSSVDSVALDSLQLRVAIADGLARVDSLRLRTPFADAEVEGSFGLVAGRRGELAYRVDVDSLQGFRRWLPTLDTGVVTPRPGRVAAELQRAREDSARVAEASEVERMAIGGAPPALRADTAGMALRREAIAGSIAAAGVLRGSVADFTLRGRAAVSDFLYGGNAVQSGKLEYAITDGGTPAMAMTAGGVLDSVQAGGFALDTVDLRVAYAKPRGTVDVTIVQDTLRDYRVLADVVLRPEQNEVILQRTALRFDTTTWRSARPGRIAWGPAGVVVDELDLRSGPAGRIYVDGRLPTGNAPANLRAEIQGLEVGHITQLLQSDVPLTGTLTLQAHAEGTEANPRLRAALGVTNPTYGGTAVPDLRGTMQYADRQLVADARFNRVGGQALLTAHAEVPVNLSLGTVTGSRLLDAPMVVNVRADSMPLDAMPQFTDAVSDVRGRLIGVLAARGTPRNPSLAGAMALDFASFRLVPMGVRFQGLFGALRLRGDTVVIDSLVGRAGGGTIRIAGGLATAQLARPGFDLQVMADNALVMDTDQGHLNADADLRVRGPFDRVQITGDARIRSGVIFIPPADQQDVINAEDPTVFAVIDTSVVGERELLPAQNPLMQNLRVDVGLRISHDTWVRGRDANVEIFTPDDTRDQAMPLRIRVNRARSAIVLDGRVNTDRGEYTFLGRRFLLNQGSVTFIGTPDLNPLLQITGTHEVRIPGREGLEIRVIIGGTLDVPKIALESNAQPPISQSDLLSYLAFGQSSSSLLTLEGSTLSGPGTGSGNLVGNVAGLATRQLAGVAIGVAAQEAEQDLGRSLGADVLNISPADVPAEVSGSSIEALLAGTEIEVGRYLDTRTFVAIQARPTEAVPGIRIQHRMPKGFRFEASYEPRILLRQPTLSRDVNIQQTRVLGGFLIREWRF